MARCSGAGDDLALVFRKGTTNALSRAACSSKIWPVKTQITERTGGSWARVKSISNICGIRWLFCCGCFRFEASPPIVPCNLGAWAARWAAISAHANRGLRSRERKNASTSGTGNVVGPASGSLRMGSTVGGGTISSGQSPGPDGRQGAGVQRTARPPLVSSAGDQARISRSRSATSFCHAGAGRGLSGFSRWKNLRRKVEGTHLFCWRGEFELPVAGDRLAH